MEFLLESLARYVGKTVTIFTTSGGLSGSGFTGVLIAVSPRCVKLITGIGAPPACPVGSACTGPIGDYFGGGCNSCCGNEWGNGYGYGYGYGAGGCGGFNWLGSVTEIPRITSSFT